MRFWKSLGLLCLGLLASVLLAVMPVKADGHEEVSNAYSFKFTYGNGDYYTGLVYAPPWEGYHLGYTRTTTDENGLTGTYAITGVDGTRGTDWAGLVFVDNYYDAETGQTYPVVPAAVYPSVKPTGSTPPLGIDYLGSEYGYIIRAGVPEYYFGGGYWEADVLSHSYDFTCHYANGDYYQGQFYSSVNYTVGQQIFPFTDENGQTGYYTINGIHTADHSKDGQVYVDSYYDAESGNTYTPVDSGTVVGSNYLGSEHDYIIKSGVPEYLFGKSGATFYEADLVSYAYSYKLTYGDGDYYSGTVYAAPEYGYSTGYTKTTTDEKGHTDTYTITGVTTGYNVSTAGQVYVTSYYDKESGNTYSPVSSGTVVGSNYLGSEHDYIIKSGVPEYLFGKSGATFYEADLVAYAYSFKLTYGDGDYYSGTVYAPPEYGYSTGYTKTTTDEKGHTDTYSITGVTTGYNVSKAGQVYVTSYYDKESGNTYSPVSSGTVVGSNYLGSEHDYIIKSGVPEYLFGKSGATFYEADLVAYAYAFTYTYSDGSGDSYTGTVYGKPENAPAGAGYTVAPGSRAAEGLAAEALWGRVDVASYHDGESSKDFTPVSANPLGRGGLGSEAGYIISSGISDYYFGGAGHHEADEVAYAYAFTYTYSDGSGDYYTGTVYGQPENAPAGAGYTVAPGSRAAEGLAAEALWGRVDVASYHDGESSKDFTPVSANPLGGSGLGSEAGYIISSGISDYYFGGAGHHEADEVAYAYAFTYTYSDGSGDSYSGTVYGKPENAPAGAGYTVAPGSRAAEGLAAEALWGRVDVASYHDGESSKDFTPVSANPLGRGGLGSEAGYIIASGISDYYFGGAGHHEADEVAYAYAFTYTYSDGSGDSYSGTVYGKPENAPAGAGYTVAPGSRAAEGLAAEALWGRVDVASYHDGESSKDFTPVSANPLGGSGLGSEAGYIISSGISDYYFGGAGHHEADEVAYAYAFTYTYSDGSGDSYTGTVYGKPENAPAGAGYTVAPGSRAAEGLAAEALWGRVDVASYHDGESSKDFTPVSANPLGRGGLGSEAGYIIASGISDYYFGGAGHAEADEVAYAYAFTYTYSDGSGDSYSGTVYGQPESPPAGAGYTVAPGSRAAEGLAAEALWGRVDVASYHDGESSKDFTPVSANPLGGSGLGSEAGYIISSGISDYYFGGAGHQEADEVAYAYAFTYTYSDGSGDYYTGTVYGKPENAPAGAGYTVAPGSRAAEGLAAEALWGRVDVASYHDGESSKDFTPVSANPLGRGGLGSEAGYIISSGISDYYFGGAGHHEADEVAYAYAFTYTYSDGSGDYYTGTVYGQPENAPAGAGYTVAPGSRAAEGLAAEALWGRVDVASYHDGESSKDFTPVSANPLGRGGLGSEAGYIIASGISDYYFGGAGHAEADEVAYAYAFTYTYSDGSGDSYTGTVYGKPENAPAGAGYTVAPGSRAAEGLAAEALWGRVDVASYHDGESSKDFTPVSANPLGRGGLGSEAGYIISSGISDYYFGGAGHHEADEVAYAYAFTYTYSDGSGDYYTGTVYGQPENAPAGAGYTVAPGSRAAEGLAAEALWGRVDVASYHDGESSKDFTPVSANPLGRGGLGSEAGYIIASGISDYYFGGAGHHEADLVSYAYTFKFTYGDGDYYTGTVYAAPEYGYSSSYTKTTTDEKGHTDTYTITQVSTGYDVSQAGQVYVDSYYDAGSGQTYSPVSQGAAVGTSYLGSEHDYIIQAGVPAYYFGDGYYEADIYSLYDFTYYYGDGSGDLYTGYVYAPAGLLTTGQYLYNQPQSMGGQSLGGYYYITGATSGVDPSYDAQEYITSYYDGDTGKTSYTLYSSTGQKTTNHSLYVADRRYTVESGYVYDPSVPSNDAYFGNTDVCYYFSTGSSQGSNFLAVYIADLPYWQRPDIYPYSGSELAGAVVLSYWDKHGYDNLITTDWQSSWPDNSQNSPASYVSFISTIGSYMNWQDTGTSVDDIGSGLQNYAASWWYTFTYNYYDVTQDRSTTWSYYKAILNDGRPVIVSLVFNDSSSEVAYSTVSRGYWNDGHVCLYTGFGTSSSNQKVDWNQTSGGTSLATAYVYDILDFY